MPALKERPKPFLLPEYCKGCGRCISACAKDCISLGTEINPPDRARPGRPGPGELQRLRPLHRRLPRALRPPQTPADADFELQDPAKLFGDRMTDAPEPVDIPAEIDPAPEDRAAGHQGQLRLRHRRAAGRLPPLLRLPDHPLHRGRRADGEAPAASSTAIFLQAVTEVATVNIMYGCGGAGLPLHDLHLLARLHPDAGGDLLHDRRRGARASS